MKVQPTAELVEYYLRTTGTQLMQEKFINLMLRIRNSKRLYVAVAIFVYLRVHWDER